MLHRYITHNSNVPLSHITVPYSFLIRASLVSHICLTRASQVPHYDLTSTSLLPHSYLSCTSLVLHMCLTRTSLLCHNRTSHVPHSYLTYEHHSYFTCVSLVPHTCLTSILLSYNTHSSHEPIRSIETKPYIQPASHIPRYSHMYEARYMPHSCLTIDTVVPHTRLSSKPPDA